MNFLLDYLIMIEKSMQNDHKDNWDYYRFGPLPPSSIKESLKNFIREKLHKKGYLNFQNIVNNKLRNALKLEYLYDNLESREDKELLIMVLTYRTLGHSKVKLPLNTEEYWKKLNSFEHLCDYRDTITVDSINWKLVRINLKELGYPIEFYFTPLGLMTNLEIKQYEYNKSGMCIKAEKGDIVLDAGGCWGDTALFFAHEVGKTGKVFSFEFIPNNINIFERNLALNEELKSTIELVKQPVWKEPDLKLFFKDDGPASQVSFEPSREMDGESLTTSIDDFILKNQIEKVDFIKMDIEGAEVNALLGATKTIKKFKPKLAIALYHSYDDFERIPKLIKQMVGDYKFYFSHCTIHSEESILFATIH